MIVFEVLVESPDGLQFWEMVRGAKSFRFDGDTLVFIREGMSDIGYNLGDVVRVEVITEW